MKETDQQNQHLENKLPLVVPMSETLLDRTTVGAPFVHLMLVHSSRASFIRDGR